MSTPKPLIIIAEDDVQIAQMISEQLENAGMLTQVYHRANYVSTFLKSNFANLLLLDVNLPDQTGFSLVETLKKENISIPVIFVTGDDSELFKVKGLEMGGDDYITKPFSVPELIARIRAVLRRTETARDHHITKNASITHEPYSFCDALVHPLRMEIDFGNGDIHKIGKKELGILTYVVENANTVITRKSLIHAVWGVHADVRSRSLDQYIVKIRTAFSDRKLDMEQFRTIHGIGYSYSTESSELLNKPYTPENGE